MLRDTPCQMVQYVHSGTIHTKARRGEAARNTSVFLYARGVAYTLAKTNHCTVNSNDYSYYKRIHRFYNFESSSCRLYSRDHTHISEAKRVESRLASLMVGEAKFAPPRVSYV